MYAYDYEPPRGDGTKAVWIVDDDRSIRWVLEKALARENLATRSFANIPGRAASDPAAAPYLGQHTEEVLAERLGLATGAIGDLVDRGVARLSDRDG